MLLCVRACVNLIWLATKMTEQEKGRKPERENNRIFHHENDGNGRKWKVEKSKTMRYCVIHYCVVQSKCSYIILTLQTNRRLHTLLMTRQMGMLRRKRKIGISTWRYKNMRKQRFFEYIEIKNLKGISQQRKKLRSDTLRWMDTFWPRKRTHEQHRTAWKTQKAQAWTILNWLQSGVKASWWESFEKLLLPSGFWFFYFFFNETIELTSVLKSHSS